MLTFLKTSGTSCTSVLRSQGHRRLFPIAETVRRAALSFESSGRKTSSEESTSASSSSVLSEDHFAKKDAIQQNHHRSRQGTGSRKDMAPDLIAFIENIDPVQESIVSTTKPTPAPRRIPRHLRDIDQQEEDTVVDDFDSLDNETNLPDNVISGGRQRVKMSLVEDLHLAHKIEGLETTRTTNFLIGEERQTTAREYQKGDIVDIYELLKKREAEPESEIEKFVTQVYQEYAETHEIPPKEKQQEKHKYILTCAVKYLQVPVLMRDVDGLFDGVPLERADEFRTLYKCTDVPSTTAKLVLEDLFDRRQNDDRPRLVAGPRPRPPG